MMDSVVKKAKNEFLPFYATSLLRFFSEALEEHKKLSLGGT